MVGILFACLAGGFIALQGVANARIGDDIGTWQAAALTQFTGFVAASVVLALLRNGQWRKLPQVKPCYWFGGAFAAVVIYGSVTAIHRVGMTVAVSAILISQLSFTFLAEGNGWFGAKKRTVRWPQIVGIAMMALGIAILKM